MRWVDVGRLQMARIAETMTPLLISVNGRYKIHEAGFRMTGRETWGARRLAVRRQSITASSWPVSTT